MSEEHLRFAPDILRRLGEELVPHPVQGLVELVRNAYDADAEECAIELKGTDRAGGSVVISDNGLGMTSAEVRSGWLVIGRSRKAARVRTAKGRLPVGDKGLGRLAALRLGSRAVLETRPANSPGVECKVEIEWSTFDGAETVETIVLNVEERSTNLAHGTTITVRGLAHPLTRREVTRLARSLVLLSDPFSDIGGFRAILVAPGFEDLERKVREGYLDDAEYRLLARLDSSGQAHAEVFDWKGKRVWLARHSDLRGKEASAHYRAPVAVFELWVFVLDGKSFSKRTAKLGEVRDWLQEVGGVHLYHRGLRVYPYGDQGHDWLDMNLARSRSPELRPSTNTSVGRVTVNDEGEKLLQKTDRTGFVENEAFADLRQFATDALEWMAKERVRARERAREKQKSALPKTVRRAKVTLDDAVQNLPKGARDVVEHAVRQFERAREREAQTLRQEVELYRTLSTVGTTVAVFAHESTKPVSQIEKTIGIIEDRAKAALGELYAELLQRPVTLILGSVRALKTFASVPLKLLERSQRRVTRVDVHAAVDEVLELFSPFLGEAGIGIQREFVDRPAVVHGTSAALQAIVANLVTNAINAFNVPGARLRDRMIVLRTEIARKRLVLRVSDNGPGIRGIGVDDIWLPGHTTTVGGTGLGLSIVKDTVTDLEGRVSAAAQGDLGGAEFMVELPLVDGD